MGSDKSAANNEKPAHKVTLTKPFYIGKYEVTQEQWQQVMGNNPSNFKGAKNPVDGVGYFDGMGTSMNFRPGTSRKSLGFVSIRKPMDCAVRSRCLGGFSCRGQRPR